MRHAFTLIELMIVIAIIAIIAAIAIPNLMESRVTANESAASSSLKSGVFAAQVQFQGGGYQDLDADNVGEYGTLGQLAGVSPTNKMPLAGGTTGLRALQGPLATGAANAVMRPVSNYSVATLLPGYVTVATGGLATPDLEGANLATKVPPTALQNCNAAERNFIHGAIPDSFGNTGRRVYVMTHDGLVRCPVAAASIAAWYGAPPVNGTLGTIARVRAGCVHALTGVAAAPAAGLDIGRTDNLGNYPAFSK